MLYISEETMGIICDISDDKVGAIMKTVITHHISKEPIQIKEEDDGISLASFMILQEHNKYFEKKKKISEIRSNSRKAK